MITKRSIFKLSLFLLPILLVGYWVFYDSLSTTLDEAINAQCEYFLDIPAYHVAVSPTGEVWAVTKDALLEFDGKTWRPHVEPYKYLNNVTTFFIEFDPDERLWLGSDEGILLYDDQNWEIHTNYEWGLPRTAVTSLTFDAAGRAWIGLTRVGAVSLQDDPGGGIAILEGNLWSLFSTRFGHTVTNDDILTVQFDPFGQLWVGTSNGTVAVLETALQDDYFGPIQRTDDFILPSVDESGIAHYLAYTAKIYDRKSNPPIPSASLGEVHAIEFDKKGQAWLYIRDTLYRFAGENFEVMQTVEWFKSSYVTVDPQGNVWFGSQVYDGQRWQTYDSTSSCVQNNTIHNLAFDNSGAAWISQSFYPDRIGLTKFEGNPQQTPYLFSLLRTIFFPSKPAGWIFPVALALVWIVIYLEVSPVFARNEKTKCNDVKDKIPSIERRLEKPRGRNFIALWFFTTISTTILGFGIGFAVSQLFACQRTAAYELLGSVIWGVIVGAFIGLGQSRVLANVISKPTRWIYANIVAWAVTIFLTEVNMPIVSCIASSNGPRYHAGSLVEFFQNQLFMIGSQLESMLRHAPVDEYDSVVGMFLLSSFFGLFFGLSQGIAQWWALRLEMPRSTTLITANVFIWILVFNIAVLRVLHLQSPAVRILEFLLFALTLPALVTGYLMLWLQQNRYREKTNA